MAQVRPRAIYIGLPAVGDALEKIRPDWEFLPSVPDINTLWTGLSDGSISNDLQILLVLDQFFDPKGEDTSFERLVATMSPHCFFCIVNYRPNLREHMKEKIEFEAYSTGDTSSLLYYFIDPKEPNPSLATAVNKYVAESDATDIVGIISGRTTSEDRKAIMEERSQNAASSSSEYFGEDAAEEESPYLGKIVAVTSSKGGSGKSTVALTLATYLAHASVNSVREGLEERPLKVIVLDLDVRDGQLGFLTGNYKPTVIKLRLNGVSSENIEDTVIHSQRLKIDLLLAPKRARHADDTPPEFYLELIQQLRKMYDYIIFDTSVNYLDPLLEEVAYPVADQIIFVTDIVVNSIFSMTRWIQEVTRPVDQKGMGINKNKIGIVVNKYISNVNMPGEKIKRSVLGLKLISIIPSNPKLIAHAANLQSMEQLLKSKELYPHIRRLARSIVGHSYKLSDKIEP